MLLIDKIDLVLMDQLRQATWTYRSGKWQTITLFFEKHQITLKTYMLSERRDGHAYVKSTRKFIISLTPMLRVREYFSAGKNQPHSTITEQTYMGNYLRTLFNEKDIGSVGMLGIKYVLKHYGFEGDIYKSIIPWNKQIPFEETYKRLWRNDDVREIFKGLGIPPKKSLSKMLLNHIYDDEQQCLPLLRSIKFIWDLCEDENILVETWPHMVKNFPDLWTLEDGSDKAWRAMIKKWNKQTKLRFARSLKKLTRKDYELWRDSLMMISNIYEELGEVDARGRNIHSLHNNLFGAINKVVEKKANAKIAYEEDIAKIHNFDFNSKVGAYEFILPQTTHEISAWGKKLSNCMSGYANSVFSRDTTLVGIINRLDNELIAGLELRRRKIRQMSMYQNQAVDDTLKLAILTAMMDVGAIDTIHPEKKHNDWYRLTREQRENLEKQMWLPGVGPIVDIGTFDPDRQRHYNP